MEMRAERGTSTTGRHEATVTRTIPRITLSGALLPRVESHGNDDRKRRIAENTSPLTAGRLGRLHSAAAYCPWSGSRHGCGCAEVPEQFR